jgi:citrate lyase subunit beta/citryl-CoA lyase
MSGPALSGGGSSTAPHWRSLLYVPADVDRYVEKAASSAADGIILDLEDSIAPAKKADARAQLPERIKSLESAPLDVLVRINAPWRLAVRDLEAGVQPGVKAIVCPKITSPDHIRAIAEIVGELEMEIGLPHGRIRLVALVECAAAFFRIGEIAVAEPRLIGVNLGTEDLAAELGVDPADEESGLLQAKLTTIMANRKAGLEPMGLASSMANFRDLDRLGEIAARSRRMGFVGATCIHPAQVAVLNRAFSPTEEERDWASRAKDAFEAAISGGSASVALDGAMIDTPVYHRALRLLSRGVAQPEARPSGRKDEQ